MGEMLTKQQQVFWETIQVLHDNDILPHVIIIGSWAEYLYEIAYLKDYEAQLRTMDLDFLIPNIRQPRKPIRLVDVLEANGYLSDTEYGTGITKFFKDGVLELEFLVRELGAGKIEPYTVESLGIKAEGLRNMDVLSDNLIWLAVRGFAINVPIPQAYILHKLIISPDRSPLKREKDIRAVTHLFQVLQTSQHEMDQLKQLFGTLTAKQRRIILDTCREYALELTIA